MAQHYIYAHSNSEYGVFYVGKGSGDRLYVTGNRSEFWKKIAKEHGYSACILEECETEDHAFDREKYWIGHYKERGECIANISLGGKGVLVDKRWWGDKIAEAMRGKKYPKGSSSKNYIDFADKETLHELYEDKGLSITAIADMFGVSSTTAYDRLKSYGIEIRDIKKRGKHIVCRETGEEFPSIIAAAKKLGVFRENIRKVLAGKYHKTGGYSFFYKED